MRPLPISLLIFLSLAPLRTSRFLPAPEQRSGRTPAPSTASTTNRSNERTVQHIKHLLLQALNLQHIPRIHTETVKQLRSMWRARLQAMSHISASGHPAGTETHSQSEVPVTGTNVSTTPTSPRHCCQTAAQISLTDLGWEHWILYPEQITYVHCASCRHPRDVSIRCHQNQTSSSTRAHRRHCCKAVKTVWIPIVYMDEDLSLVISNIPLTEECGEEQ
ncbi:uncharacterized protein LOC127586939 [Pristis pectinata]|uniref:uncharacterized protein LOC127586939 n=1 Tax=Pristis pectinata TaxID=685728 RepID=UPI00223DC283|nr:uncharacterized protein LOC127586939 [Pristis pectinata]